MLVKVLDFFLIKEKILNLLFVDKILQIILYKYSAELFIGVVGV